MARVNTALVALVLSLIIICPVRADESQAERKLKFSDCPPAIRKTLRREASGVKIDEVIAHTEDSATLYTAGVSVAGSDYQLLVAEDGTLVQKVLDDGEDHTETEADLDIEECPPDVQKTLDREAHGYQIDLVVERVTDGRTVYLADVQLDKRDYLLIVGEDGTLISKTLYEDQDEFGSESETIEI